MSLHKEISFETEICEHLGANGWFYAEGDAAGYDRARTRFPPDLLAWVQATQPIAWETLTKNHGSQAGETLIARARDRIKLDAAGHYDDFEADRVVAVELSPASRQSDLIAALEPVRDRIIKRYKAAQETLKVAKEKKDDGAVKAAQDELNALILFKSDMGAYIRLYTFLSQIFDLGNTSSESAPFSISACALRCADTPTRTTGY